MQKPSATTRAKEELEHAAADAVRVIAAAAERATSTVADAAASAAKVLSSAVADAAKVTSAQTSGDHDLIVELRTKMDDLKIDIREIRDGTTARIETLEREKLNIRDSYPTMYKQGVEEEFLDHETRLRTIETNLTRVLTYGTALVILVGIAEFLITSYLRM